MGNVDESIVEQIEVAVAQCARAHAPFAVAIDKVSAFPNERKPRTVYAGARSAGAPFRALAHSVRSSVQHFGFTFAEDAVFHVTLARVRETKGPLPQIELAPAATLLVSEIALFESIFDSDQHTSRYAIRSRAPVWA